MPKLHILSIKAKQAILKHKIIESDDKILVGVSGGADSVALLHVLIGIRKIINIKSLSVGHLNHLIRQEAYQDELFVKELCQKLNLPFFSKQEDVRKYKLDKGLSLEEAGREVRYKFYQEIADEQGFNKIALGHHLEDNAELILMNILRGSGTLGLSGMAYIKDIANITIIRPLLDATKQDILDFIKINNLNYVTDLSNFDLKYLRNKIRLELIPYLTSNYNPKISESLVNIGSIIRDESKYIDKSILPIFKNCVLSQEKNKLILKANRINILDISLQRKILRLAIRQIKTNLKAISYKHIDFIIGILDKKDKLFNLPENIFVRKQANLLILEKN